MATWKKVLTEGAVNASDFTDSDGTSGQVLQTNGSDTLSWGNKTTNTNTNQLTTFTVSATTDSTATTISQDDDLMFAAGTGIACETTADGTVTITNTIGDSFLTTEEVQDICGGMFTNNTEARATAVYDDANAKVNLTIDDMTANTQLSTEEVQDIVGGMLVGTETRIGVTYDDTNGRINFVVDDMTANDNTMGSGFTVSATTDTTATTITQGDDLFFAAGTGISCTTSANGTVTIVNTSPDANHNTDVDVSVANLKTRLAGGFGGNAVTIGDSTDTVTIAGNLVVSGETATMDVTTLSVEDKIIELASGATSAATASGAGININTTNGTQEPTIEWTNSTANAQWSLKYDGSTTAYPISTMSQSSADGTGNDAGVGALHYNTTADTLWLRTS